MFSQANVFWEKFTVWKILEMVSLDNLFETNGKKLTQICGCEQTAAKFGSKGSGRTEFDTRGLDPLGTGVR